MHGAWYRYTVSLGAPLAAGPDGPPFRTMAPAPTEGSAEGRVRARLAEPLWAALAASPGAPQSMTHRAFIKLLAAKVREGAVVLLQYEWGSGGAR